MVTLTLHIEHSGSQNEDGTWGHIFTLGNKYCSIELDEMDPEPDVALKVEKAVQFSLFIGPISNETLIPMSMAANNRLLAAKDGTDEEFDAAMAEVRRVGSLVRSLDNGTLYF